MNAPSNIPAAGISPGCLAENEINSMKAKSGNKNAAPGSKSKASPLAAKVRHNSRHQIITRSDEKNDHGEVKIRHLAKGPIEKSGPEAGLSGQNGF